MINYSTILIFLSTNIIKSENHSNIVQKKFINAIQNKIKFCKNSSYNLGI